MRTIKFRGKIVDNGEWVYGCLVNNLWVKSEHTSNPGEAVYEIIPYESDEEATDWCEVEYKVVEVIPETVGQYAGLKDKNDKEIWEGSIVRWYKLEIEYQTHYGDNISNGAYTEPCGIKTFKFERPVEFREGKFRTDLIPDPEEEEGHPECALHWKEYYDRQQLNYIFYPRPHGREDEVLNDDEFLETCQSVAEELGFKCESIEDFISQINGIEIIGNVHENPELLNK